MDKSQTNILIASDHAGFALKESLKQLLPKLNWKDLGPFDTARVDYPDFADRVASEISHHGGRAVLICGSGQGMVMRANRYPNVRAALVYDETSARLTREHNDANIICMGSRVITPDQAKKFIELFFATPFSKGRHQIRVDKLSGYLK